MEEIKIMSLKLNKHVMLIFMVLLMLLLIPMSFASDVDDDGSVIGSADDAVVASSVDDANATVSATADTSDVLSESGDVYVDITAPDGGTGSDTAPYNKIADALANSADGATIHIASGTYLESGLSITKNVTIIGSGMDDVIIDAQGSGRIFEVTESNIGISISSLTLENGKVSGTGTSDPNYYGGAIKVGTGITSFVIVNLTLSDVKFMNNKAPAGGAIYINRGKSSGYPLNNLSIDGCEFIENVATNHAGAIYTLANTKITDSIFINNKLENPAAATSSTSSYYGGAVRVDNFYMSTSPNVANLEITGCVFENNSATGKGGALYINTGKSTSTTALINYNAFINNTAKYNTGSSSNLKSNNDTGISAGSNKNIDLNNNWWGYNDVDLTKEISSSFPQPTIYAKFNLTANPTEISGSETSDIVTAFVWSDGNTADIDKLPVRAVKLTTNGTLTETDGDVGLTSVFSADADGTYVVNATVDNQKSSVTITRETNLIDSELTVNPTSATIEIGDTYNLAANVSVVSGAGVTYSSNDTNVASVDSNTGLITAVGEGTANITVTAGDGQTYAVETKNFIVTVSKITTSINIVEDAISLNVNDKQDVGASLDPAAAGALTFSSNNDSVAKVEDGKIVAYAKGNAVITVSYGGDNKYAAAEDKTISVTVNLNDASVSAENINVDIDENKNIVATIVPGDKDLTVSYSGFDEEFISVSDAGVVTGIKEGSTTVTLTINGNGVYADNTTSITVTVSKIATTIEIANPTVSLKVEESVDVGASLNPAAAGALTFSSNNDSVAKVEDGKIVAYAKGNAVITVSYGGNDKYAAAEDKTIDVSVALADASVSASDVAVDVHGTTTITPTINPVGIGVTYESANPEIATVDENTGLVTGIKGGNTTITIKTVEDGIHAINSTVINVTVNKLHTEIVCEDISVEVGKTVWVGYTWDIDIQHDGSSIVDTINYDIDNDTVISYDGSDFKALKAGTTTINASYAGDDTYEASYKIINVEVKLAEVTFYGTGDIDVYVNYTAEVATSVTPLAALDTLKYEIDDESVAIYNETTGLIQGVSAGTVKLTVTAGDDVTYAVKSVDVTVNVKAPADGYYITTPSDNKVDYVAGSNKNISFTVDYDIKYPDDMEWSGSEPMYIYIDGTKYQLSSTWNQSVSFDFKAIYDDMSWYGYDDVSGTYEAYFAPDVDALEYAMDSKNHTFNKFTLNIVNEIIKTNLTVGPSELDLTVGGSDSIVATVEPGDLAPTFSSDNESVVTVDAEGNVVAVGAGSAIITVTAGDGVTYAVNTTTVAVSVNKKETNLAVEPVELNLIVGGSETITATVTPNEAGAAIFKSSNESVVTVDDDGVVTAVGAGNAIITVTAGDNETYAINETTVPVSVIKDLGDTIFVSNSTGNDNSGDGSESAPYATLSKALTEVSDSRNKIVILEGAYSTASSYAITKSVSITGRGNVSLTKSKGGLFFEIRTNGVEFSLSNVTIENISAGNNANGYVVYASTDSNDATDAISVTIDNCTIRNNNASSGINRMLYGYHANLTVLHSNIIDNHAGSNLVYVGQASLIMNYNNILDNTATANLFSGLNPKGNINYNFWGTQEKPSLGDRIPTFDNWVVVDASIDNEIVPVGNNYNLDFEFKSTTDGSTLTALDDVMPSISFDLTSDLENTLGDSTITMTDNKATTTYAADNTGNEVINVSYTDVVGDLTFEVIPKAAVYVVTPNETVVNYTLGEDYSIDFVAEFDDIDFDYYASIGYYVDGEYVEILDIEAGEKSFTVNLKDLTDFEFVVGGTYSIVFRPTTSAFRDAGVSLDDCVFNAVNVTVKEAAPVIINTSLSVDPTSFDLTVGENATIVATVTPSESGSATFKSSNESVATVDADGKVTAVGEGSAVITVTAGDGVNYTVNTTTVAVTVTAAPGKNATSIKGNDKDGKTMDVGKTTYWNVFLDPSEAGELTFTIADPSIIKIENGQITSLKAGNTTVNASFAGNDEYEAVSLIIPVTVNMADTTIYVSPASKTIEINDTYDIVANVIPSEAGLPTFSSSNESVATVDANGKVTGISEGTAIITVTAGDGINYANKSAEVTIYVEEPWVNPYYYVSTPGAVNMTYVIGKDGIITVTADYKLAFDDILDDEPIYIYIDGTQNYQREMIDGVKANATSFTFNLKDLFNLELDVGTHNISFGPDIQTLTAILYGSDNYTFNVIKVTVTDEPVVINTTITVDTTELELTVGDEDTINATLSPSQAGNVTFTSSDDSIVTVDADGKVTAVGEGNATITVSFAGNEEYAAAENVTVTVSVTNATKPYDGIIYVSKDGKDNNDGSEGKPVATIAKAIELATSENNTAHKIVIREGTYEESNLTIASDLEIVGENAVIDAANDGRILDITAGNVKLSGITFANANVTGYGGAVSIVGAAVEIDECTFVNNTATYGAGAILWDADDGKLSNSVFENNAGRNGAAVTIGSLGWSPKGDNTEITGCVFNNNDNIYNAAGCIGLAVYVDNVKVTDTNFTNSVGQANSNHGALYILGDDCEVSGCLFENNTMDGAGALQAEGDNVNIHDNIFRNNMISGGVASRAGAIEIQSINAIIADNVFENNGGEDCREGGAINIIYVDYDGEITISGNEFINNSAAYGGAIYVDGGYSDTWGEFTLVISDNTFDGNVAGQGAGIYTYNTGEAEVTISENTFKNQVATEGGAIYSGDSYIALSANTMENCVAENGNDIFIENGEVTTETNLVISEDAVIQLGENVTVTAVLTDDNNNTISGGVITLTANGDKLDELDVVNGTVSFVFAPSEAGNYTISGSYDLASDVTVETATIEVAETPKENATITIDAPSVTEGENATVTVTLPADAGGNVTIGNVTVPVVNGTASVSVSGLPAGNNTVPVVYSGDDKYNPIETVANVTVDKKETPKENATIIIDAPGVSEGENATVTVTLPEDASGNVTIGNETVPVVNGTASAVVSGLPAGNNTVPVTYSGDDKYNPIETVANVTVDKKETPKENATVEIDAPAVTEGNNATITVSLPEDATGNVTATVGDKTYTAPVVNGTATIAIPDLAAGNYSVPVTYSGDDKYNPATKDVKVTIDEDTSDIISAPDLVKYFHGAERFIVNVTDYQGNPIANKSVIININGVPYTRTTNASGIASIAINLGAGVYNITSTVDNKSVESVITVLTTVNGTDLTKVFRNESQYYVTLRDSEGNYLADGSQVEFNINGVMYYRYVSGDKGLARLNINLNAGEYIITATNLETGEMSSNNITVLPRLIENKDITKYFRNGTQYTVKVIGDDGNPVGAGENVTFNINGVFYNRTTDENGIAKLNINLRPGDYIITAIYKGFMVSNNISVLPVLTASDLTKTYGTSDQFVANLVDGQGNPLSGKNVSFNINGVFYNRTTDADGNARLNINLMPGEYIITSRYEYAEISNTVKVNA